jgi:hypothetical protein
MHPKAYDILVTYERNERLLISKQIAKLSQAWEESWAREQAIELPEVQSE